MNAPTPRRWDYTTDGVGNILGIEQKIGCAEQDLVLAHQTVSTTESFTTCAGIEAGPAFTVDTGGDVTFTAGVLLQLKDDSELLQDTEPGGVPHEFEEAPSS